MSTIGRMQLGRGKLRERLDREKLEKLYIQERMSTVLISDCYGVVPGAVLNLLIEYGIPRRGRGGVRP